METCHSILPEDVDALRAMIAAQADQLAEQARKRQSPDTLIDKLKAQLAVLKRARFGSSSEKMDRAIEQLELALEDIEAAKAEDSYNELADVSLASENVQTLSRVFADLTGFTFGRFSSRVVSAKRESGNIFEASGEGRVRH